MSTCLGISDEEDFLYYFSLAKPSLVDQKVSNSHELLISKSEIIQYKLGNILSEEMIKTRSDIPTSRNKAKELLEKKIFNPTMVMSCLLKTRIRFSVREIT
ncbi:hypothetical protein [Alkalihalobacillus sp. BA299]|uniref:hypothetical protein n=1 Tax=Alkalihalobacillus sp. BA299 TaxID=2815938 RepID=UPI001ADA0D81|nr:hypothetical protein [Alkalihalobacillus sp. BA299]